MAGLIWLWNQGGAAADITPLIASYPVADAYWFEEQQQEVWDENESTLDVTPQFFPPAAPSVPIEAIIYPLAEQPWFPEVETEDYSFAEQLEFLAPPEINLAGIIGSFDTADDYLFIPEETEDYATDLLDIVPQLFPPAIVEPVETFASQFLPDQPFWEAQETEDYAFSEQLEFLAPPEVPLVELTAAQPHYGELPIPADETEDYANDTALDVTAFFFPTAVEPVETFAAQPLAEQYLWPAEEIEDYLALPEQNEWTAPPEVGSTELIGSQPHYGEAFWPEAETEDYQADSTLDPVPTLFPTAAEAIEVFASQPHYGEWFWEAEETQDYQPLDDVSPLFTEVPATIENLTSANYSTFHEIVDNLIYETLEDWQLTTSLELTAFLAGPPTVPDGQPVEYALATDTAAYANGQDQGSEAKVLETVGASSSRETYSEAKAVDTT